MMGRGRRVSRFSAMTKRRLAGSDGESASRWPILDVHDVKQQDVSQLRFTHVQSACMKKLESLRPSPQARSIVRAHGSARVMRPPSLLRRARLSAPRLHARRSAKRKDGVIRWWSDDDRARANDWRPQRVVRESPRQQIGSLTCGVDAGHCGSLLPFGGGVRPAAG